MDGIKILHTGDLHLGMPFTGSRLPPSVGKVRRQELWETFDRIIDIAKAEKTDLLLIAGDLFEYAYCTASDIKRINSRFARIPDTYILITPGNHDPIFSDSLYNTCPWEQNVHVFKESKVTAHRIEKLNTTVWGLGWDQVSITKPILEGFRTEEPGINILMAHCDVALKGEPSQYLPVHRETLANSGAHYTALGHIHKRGEIKQEDKRTAIYCGSPEPLDFSEGADHGIYLGTVGRGFCDVNFLPVAKRKFITEEMIIDPTGDITAIIKSMENLLKKHGRSNMFRFLLNGTVDPGADIDISYLEQGVEAFHVEVKNDTHTGYDLDSLIKEGQNNIMGAFVSKLLTRLDYESDPAQKAVLERALYIGLDALKGRKVIGR